EFSGPTGIKFGRAPHNLLLGGRDRSQIKMGPGLAVLLQDVANQIIRVKSLHDDYDHAVPFVVQPRVESAIEPIVDPGSLCFGIRLLGLDRVVNDNEVTAPSG